MRSSSRKAAFTMIEILVVVALIGLLVGLLVPAVQKGILAAKKNQVRNDLRDIRGAVHAYYQEYGHLPIPADQENCTDFEEYNPEGEDAQWVMIVLGGDTNASEVQEYNPRGMPFLSSFTNTLTGEFKDPWGTQYAMKFDCNYNGKVEYYSGSGDDNIPDIVVAISYGPDRKKCESQNLGDCDDMVSYNFKENQ